MRKLVDFAEIIMGQSPRGSSYNKNEVGLPLLNGAADFDKKSISPSQYTSEPTKSCRKGDILLCIRATIGNARFADKEYCLGRGVSAIRIKESTVLPRYILFLLEKKVIDLASRAEGSTIKGLRKEDLENLEFDLPPLPIQKRIVSILERAEKLKEKRQKANEETKQIIQSIFYEMFGDPVKNEKGWEMHSIMEVTNSFDNRRVPLKQSDREKISGNYPYYGASGIIDYVDDYIFDFEAVLIGEDGANLISRSTPIAFLASGKYWVNNHAHVLTANELTNNQFLIHFFNSIDLKPFISGSAQPKLTANLLNKILIPVPPIELQNEFAEQVKMIELLRKNQKQSTEQIDTLFDALMQKAFNGELVN